ncbi:MAG: type II toxin-antitoxin system VapC family toxin [Lachnospiraceae bacterium]|nr:type II toxin-antitoxin system VapC family toxin [Lachnospiraceae bacterium]
MKCLLDTNALIIMMFGEIANSSLSSETIKMMEEADELYVSDISFWEMAIKIKIGKLSISQPLEWIVNQCKDNGISTIPVTIDQIAKTMELPLFKDHTDPFDRLIISVGKLNDLTLISTDGVIRDHYTEYGIDMMW